MADIDDDLRDVFRSLYDGEEWGDWADDVEAADQTAMHAAPNRYSKATLRSALASLLVPTPVPTKRKIYAPPTPAAGLIPSTSPLPAVDMHAYAPFSPLPLLEMLRTYTPRTWSPLLPAELSPAVLACAGWVNNARDGVVCAGARGSASAPTAGALGCTATWGVGGLSTIRDVRVRTEVVRRLSSGLARRHEPGCGWRVRGSPASLVAQLRRTVHPLVASSLGPLARALAQRSVGPVRPRWTSPVSGTQLDALAAALARYDFATTAAELGHLEVALALFGWYPHDPTDPSDHVSLTSAPGEASKTDIVACRMCLRRVGLWMFTGEGEKCFDLHKEHLWWCPLAADGWWESPLLEAPAPIPDVPRIGERAAKRRKGEGRAGVPSTSAPSGSPAFSGPASTSTSAPSLVMA